MFNQEEVTITLPLDELNEILRLANKIALPDVTYCDDKLVMADQAIRLSRMAANSMQEILFKYV